MKRGLFMVKQGNNWKVNKPSSTYLKITNKNVSQINLSLPKALKICFQP